MHRFFFDWPLGVRMWVVAGALCAAAVGLLYPTGIVKAGEPAWFALGGNASAAAQSEQAGHSRGASAEQVGAQDEQTEEQRIRWLIEQLGHSDYHMREQAQAELTKLGFAAFEALSEVVDNPTKYKDQELAARAKYLLRTIRAAWASHDDPPEVQNLLKDYESQPMAGKISRMRELAALPNGAGLPAICRLVRYERPLVLSRQAVVQLLLRRGATDPPTLREAEIVAKHLGASNRVAADWLRCWALFADNPEQAAAKWHALIESERNLLRAGDQDTNRDILAAMLRFEIGWSKQLGRPEQVVLALREVILLEPGSDHSLEELLEWMLEQKAWSSVDELAERFQDRLAANAILMYQLARSHKLRGDSARAEEVVQQALRTNPGGRLEDLLKHRAAAHWLRRRGLADWAEQEFRHVIDNSGQNHTLKVSAQIELAEMFHDRGHHLQAAELLKQACQTQEEQSAAFSAANIGAIRSRMYYFLACDSQLRNQPDKQRQYLLKAVPLDEEVDTLDVDLDAVIALYRMKDNTPEQRRSLSALIARMAEEYENDIEAEDPLPERAKAMNHYAWLVANTEGDLDKALRYSLRSIELAPDVGAYHDTLAHVYFAKGDYENAVRCQTRAAQLEPHSSAINRQLEFFRAKLEEKRAADQSKPQG